MIDDSGSANVIHCPSNRCKEVTGLGMAAEIHSIVIDFDYPFVINHMTEELLNRKVRLDEKVDNRSVFDNIPNDGLTSERVLQIDIHALCQ